MGIHYIRNPRVSEQQLEQSHFLANPDNDRLFYLNSMGAAIWRLLEQPTDEESIVGILQAAFPEEPAETLSNSVAALLGELQRGKLIEIATDNPEQAV